MIQTIIMFWKKHNYRDSKMISDFRHWYMEMDEQVEHRRFLEEKNVLYYTIMIDAHH